MLDITSGTHRQHEIIAPALLVANHQGTNALETEALTAAGPTNLEAIRAATIRGAELLAWQDMLGSLETEKLADIDAVSGNPLTDIKQVEHALFVMKGGVVIKDEHKVSK